MEYRPHEYQSRATAWVESHPRCCLFMEMGLGKTVATLTAIDRLLLAGEIGSALVIAPASVAASTWHAEAAKWDHLRGLRVARAVGTAAQRRRALASGADVCVLGRDNVAWLLRECGGAFPHDMVVLDELTSFKSPSSLRFKALRLGTAATPRVVGLTGTPTPNGLADLWAQVFCIDRGERLGRSVTGYRRRWFNVVEHNHIPIKVWPKPGAREEIMAALSDICLAMRAGDYLSLPPLLERDVPVALTDAERRAYARFERETVMGLPDGEVTAPTALALAGKLAQYASGAVYDEQGRVHRLHDHKTGRLLELVEAADGPVLCFHSYRHEADRVMQAAPRGLRVRRYAGAGDLADWNAGKVDLLLAHPASAAFGLNMQAGGHTIVWYGPCWDLELYQQANARLHRQGQLRPVVVHRLVAVGTVDERICAALAAKQSGQAAVMAVLGGLKR